jgi:hypothetical protein
LVAFEISISPRLTFLHLRSDWRQCG